MNTENTLFPIFLKLEELDILLVGGGHVAAEKLSAILRNSPKAKVQIVAPFIRPELWELIKDNSHVHIWQREFRKEDLAHRDIVFLATDNEKLHADIKRMAKVRHLLVNVADTPHLCDFYLGSVVQRGLLKVGISTNGKSPTFAKRLREILEESLPESNNVSELLESLYKLREKLKGNFQEKVDYLNKLTRSLSS